MRGLVFRDGVRQFSLGGGALSPSTRSSITFLVYSVSNRLPTVEPIYLLNGIRCRRYDSSSANVARWEQ
jgi:hypothetical protein